jgi:hypothetical protein
LSQADATGMLGLVLLLFFHSGSIRVARVGLWLRFANEARLNIWFGRAIHPARWPFTGPRQNIQGLLFALFLMAIIATSEEESQEYLGMPQDQAFTRFSSGTRRTLRNEAFFNKNDFFSIQILAVYTVGIPTCLAICILTASLTSPRCLSTTDHDRLGGHGLCVVLVARPPRQL